jgi:hypothetical protein
MSLQLIRVPSRRRVARVPTLTSFCQMIYYHVISTVDSWRGSATYRSGCQVLIRASIARFNAPDRTVWLETEYGVGLSDVSHSTLRRLRLLTQSQRKYCDGIVRGSGPSSNLTRKFQPVRVLLFGSLELTSCVWFHREVGAPGPCRAEQGLVVLDNIADYDTQDSTILSVREIEPNPGKEIRSEVSGTPVWTRMYLVDGSYLCILSVGGAAEFKEGDAEHYFDTFVYSAK